MAHNRQGDTGNSMNRRSVLKVAGAASVIGLTGIAGCMSDDGTNPRPGVGGDNTDGDGGNNNDGDEGDNKTSSGNTVKIGSLTPLTGTYGGLGKFQKHGLEIAAKDINANGGINGTDIEFLFEDSQGSPQTALQKARKLVNQDGVVALTGAISSAVGLVLADFAAEQNMVYLCPTASNEITMNGCKKTTFRYELRASQCAAGSAPWAVNKFGTDMWVHNADYTWGNSVADSFIRSAKAANPDVQVLGHTKSELGAKDFSAYVSQIAASNAEWLLTGLNGGDAVNFLKQAASYGLKDKVTIVSPTNSFQFIRKAAGQAAVDTYSTIRYYARYDVKANETFVNRYSNTYGVPPDNFANVSWTDAHMYAKAANETGTTETGAMIKALETVQYESPMGPADFRGCDHQAVRPVIVGKIVPPANYDWPDLEVLQTTPGKEAIIPCKQTGCSL
jgi:branched-chain amino acid transport system substrate-binding protein